MRTLIFGSKGQLGRDLLKVFQAAGEVCGLDLPELDIADAVAVTHAAEAFGPDLIVNSAAYTDVDGAEDHLESAFLVNETGARNAADVAARLNIPVVYYSTDFVFDGKSEIPYAPADPIAPLSVYGKSKAAGETAVRRNNGKHFILRTAWLYGPGGNNFVEKILRAAASRPSLRVVDDEIGSPTHTFDLAEATLALVRAGACGIYHVVNAGECSRYEQALDAIRLAGLSTHIEPCAAAEFPAKAPRPRYSVLDTDATCTRIGRPMRHWQDALRHYMKRRGTPA